MSNIKTSLNIILIFQNGNLINQLRYNTKKETIGNYRIFKKYGLIDHMTGEPLLNIKIELL